MVVVQGKTLKLGENTDHRLCRPAWTSETKTGMFDSANHRHDRHLRYRFYVKSHGLYKKMNPSRPIKGKRNGKPRRVH